MDYGAELNPNIQIRIRLSLEDSIYAIWLHACVILDDGRASEVETDWLLIDQSYSIRSFIEPFKTTCYWIN